MDKTDLDGLAVFLAVAELSIALRHRPKNADSDVFANVRATGRSMSAKGRCRRPARADGDIREASVGRTAE